MNLTEHNNFKLEFETLLEIKRIPHEVGSAVSLFVLNEIKNGNTYFTSGSVKYFLNIPDKNDIHVLQTLVLMSSPRLNLLTMGFNFVTDNEDQVEITTAELNDASKSGIFYNPETGEPVENYMKKIYPFFRVVEN